MRFKLGACRIQVDFLFAAMAALMLVLGEPPLIIALLTSSVCHELGHVAALLLCRGKIALLRLSAFGMCLERQGNLTLSYRQEMACAWAGPGVNLLLGGLFYCMGQPFWMPASINFCLGLFNLLPAFPMDGGRGLYYLLLSLLPERAARPVMLTVTFLTLLLLFFFGILLLFQSKYNISMLVVSVYLLIYIMVKPID